MLIAFYTLLKNTFEREIFGWSQNNFFYEDKARGIRNCLFFFLGKKFYDEKFKSLRRWLI